MDKYTWEVPCGIQFTTCHAEGEVLVERRKSDLYTHGDGVVIEREGVNPSPTAEEIETFNIFTKSATCTACTKCTLKDTKRHLGRKGGDFKNTFDVIDTMCIGKLVNHPWPVKCPVTGDSFSRMGYNMTDDDIAEGYIPLYLNAERNELHNIPALYADDNEITFRYRVAVEIDEEDVIEWESCISHHVPNGHKIILNKFDEIINKHKDTPGILEAVTELRSLFSGMKVKEED